MLDGSGWLKLGLGRFAPRNDPVPVVEEAVLAPEPAQTVVENLASTGIRSLDRRTRSESLHLLRCSALRNILYDASC